MANDSLSISLNEEDLKSIKETFNRIDPKAQDGIAKKMMVKAGALMEGSLKKNVANVLLKVRSGRLSNSIGFIVRGEGADLKAEIGSGVRNGKRVVYANILETGGKIVPKKSQYLTIPLPGALTASGVARKPNARSWKNTFVARAKSGNLVIFQNQTKGKVLPLYVLKKSVTIKPKLWMSKTVIQNQAKVLDIMKREIDEALQ